MSTLVVYADSANSGYNLGIGSTYANCRTASPDGGLSFNVGGFLAGQTADFIGTESLMEFDTTLTGSVSSAVLATSDQNEGSDFSGHSDTLRARLFDFGTADTGDWLHGVTTGKTLLAHLASGSISQTGYDTWTDDAFAANVNTAGKTRIVVMTARWEAGTAPTGNEIAAFDFPGDQSTDPKLTITYSVASADVVDPMGMSGFFGQ